MRWTAAATLALLLAGCVGGATTDPVEDDDEGPGPSPTRSSSATAAPSRTHGPSASGSSTSAPAPPAPAEPAHNGTGENQTTNQTRPPQPFEPTEPSGTCGSFDSLTPVAPDPALAPGLALGWPLLRLDIALVADPSFVATHGAAWQDALRDLVADASVHYEAQMGLRLNASLLAALPDGTLEAGRDDGLQRAIARGYMQANHPDADVDAVAVILGSDYEGTTAGQVECVHGAAYKDYSYLWSEYDEPRTNDPFLGGVGLFEDTPLKVFMHELAHLLAAHHHYSTCGRSVRTSDALAICDVMINDIGLASYEFSPTNRLVMRSFVEDIGIGRPV